MKMHEDEIVLTLPQIKEMLLEQYPETSDLILDETDIGGTANHVFRLGEKLCLRLPRRENKELLREVKWLTYIKPYISLLIPAPVFVGRKTDFYPSVWTIYQYITGTIPKGLSLEQERKLAESISGFIHELQAIPVPADAPKAGRKPIRQLEGAIENCIREYARDYSDSKTETLFLSILEDGLKACAWDEIPVFIHADLLPTNLLMEDGELKGILDFGTFGAGDPAFDLIPAWTVFGPEGRAYFRTLVQADADAWKRAKTYAMYQALMIIPYYEKSYPAFTEMAQNTLQQILADNVDDTL